MSFVRRHWFWLTLCAVVLGGLASSQGVRDYVSRRKTFRQLDSRLSDSRARVADKQALLARAQKDDGFLELEARRHLGLVKPDEVEFRFTPAKPGAREGMESRRPSAAKR